MKKITFIFIVVFICCVFNLQAQVAINTTGAEPSNSAMLDVSSDTAGILIPRMTAAKRDGISDPATGLLVFCTDDNQFYSNKGTPAAPNWVMISTQWFLNGTKIYFNGGKVGIGTSDPNADLDIRSSGTDIPTVLSIGNSDRTHSLSFFPGRENDPNPFIQWKDGDPLRFSTDEGGWSEKMRIQSDGSVGIGTNAPDGSALLEINSNSKGLLPPRMTSNQMYAISNPQEGLMVYNFDIKTLCWFNGAEWIYESKYQNCGRLEFEGQIYTTVVIGSQCWMQENLTTAKYNNGTDIPYITGDVAWAALTTPGYCWYYDDSATYAPVYGALYNWYTVNTANLCPSGWHIPTDDEWKTMEMYLGMSQAQADATLWRGTDEGGKLKETGTTHWSSPNTGATNTSGFTALPGGYRGGTSGNFSSLGYYGYWWSATENSSTHAWYRYQGYSNAKVGRSTSGKGNGFSVRCLRD